MYSSGDMWWVAASPIVFFVGLGTSWQHRHDAGTAAAEVEPAIDAVAGYRVHEHVAVGLRASVSQVGYREELWGNSSGSVEATKLHTLELALAVPLELNRFVVTPWLGRHYANGRFEVDDYTGCMDGCRLRATTVTDVRRSPLTVWGVLVGFDAIVDGMNRLSVFVDVQGSTAEMRESALGPVTDYDYQAVTFGLAYRR